MIAPIDAELNSASDGAMINYYSSHPSFSKDRKIAKSDLSLSLISPKSLSPKRNNELSKHQSVGHYKSYITVCSVCPDIEI